MPPELAREVRRWLRYAQEDLATAEALRAESPPRHAAWLAQQAAEKAIRAVLVAVQVPFPFVHDLERLVALVPEGWGVRGVKGDLSLLTDFAVDARYPDDLPDIDREAAQTGVDHARRVVAAVEADPAPALSGGGGPPAAPPV